MNIRNRLRLLILATLIPVAVFGAAGAYVLFEKERDTFARGALARVRALATAIHAQLHASVTPLEVLARSPALGRDDLTAFRSEAQRALDARRGEWANLLVSDAATGEMLVNLMIAPGEPMQKAVDPATIVEAAQTGQPTVSKVGYGPRANQLLFAVRVPVSREGGTRYVLSALVDPAVIGAVVDRQQFPETWAVAVIDRANGFVVRRPAPEKGEEAPSASLVEALQSANEGWQPGRLRDGSEIYRAFQKSAFSRWAVSIAIPRAVVDESLQVLWTLIAGFVGAAVAGLAIAWKLASGISRPITALAAAAPALGRGEALALPPPADVDEVRELSQALGDASRAVREREERQRAAEQALRAADRAKDEFLAMLGHELRNPLASVSNAAQLLKVARNRPPVLENVSAILGRQVEHMTRLVDDLLEVGRLTGGKVRLQCAPLDLAAFAAELVQRWQSAGRFVHHALRQDLQAVWVSADRARIEQVISNLLDNALKYTPSGGTVCIAVRRIDMEAVLEVSDTGEGMGPQLVGRVFDLFVQGERSLAREAGGLGIGLTMAKRLVELHGGTIAAASPGAGKGATFTVALPAIDPPAARAWVRPAAPEASRSRRILIVEDNADARESLAALLRLTGHAVDLATDATQGIEAARRHAPDVMLIDIGLPDMSGYELARRLRSDGALDRPHLIALTGYGTAEDRRQALAAGFDEHLVKPVELDKLQALLNTLEGATTAADRLSSSAPSP